MDGINQTVRLLQEILRVIARRAGGNGHPVQPGERSREALGVDKLDLRETAVAGLDPVEGLAVVRYQPGENVEAAGRALGVGPRAFDERIEAASFEGEGCTISQAGGSIITEMIEGMTIEELKALGVAEVFGPGSSTEAIVEFVRDAVGAAQP